MSWTVTYGKKAAKQYDRLPSVVQDRLDLTGTPQSQATFIPRKPADTAQPGCRFPQRILRIFVRCAAS